MGMASAGSIVGFEGTLVQKRHDTGQKYIQLVFSTTEGIRLSVSRNLRMARSLTIGRTYQVKGIECLLGKKTYIREPVAIPVYGKNVSAFSRRKIVVTVSVMLILAGSVLVFFTATKHSRAASAGAQRVKTQTKNTVESTPAPKTAETVTTQPNTPAAAAPATTAKKTTTKQTAKPAASANAQPSNSATAETPNTPAAESPPAEQPPIEETPPTTTDPPAENPPPETP